MGLIANDQLTKKYCQLVVGSRALVVLAIHEGEFRKSLRQIAVYLKPNGAGEKPSKTTGG
jgi:hypothetical protein